MDLATQFPEEPAFTTMVDVMPGYSEEMMTRPFDDLRKLKEHFPMKIVDETTDGGVIFKFDLPEGLSEGDVDVEIKGSMLCIHAKHREEARKEGENVEGMAVYMGSFEVCRYLPPTVDVSTMQKSVSGGVLEVSFKDLHR
ncbi:MAG: HSP20 family protein [Amphiamblys sp. WSBS2006]|nr:MAG: HSP20 family protein [Amphiamblys sp. WSBS2006]